MRTAAPVFTAFVVVVAASAQLRVVQPIQAEASPTSWPEPRFQIAEDPLIIFQNLISSSSANRRDAIVQLGWKDEAKFAEDPAFIGDARFYRVNLDDDPDFESILMLTIGRGRETRALVFKRSDGKWWRIGSFSLWYMWRQDDAERMLELRNIVDGDHKDIVVRLTAGGSDIQREIELSIYRLYQGRLYRTFEMTEEFASRSPSSAGMQRKQILYPERDRAQGPYIVVHSSRVPETVDCVPYRWDPVKYLFTPDRPASRRLCEAVP